MNLAGRVSRVCIFGTLYFPHVGLAVTINGQNLKEIIKPDQVLVYENEKANHIAIRIQDGAIEIGQLDIQDDIKRVKQFYSEFQAKKDQLSLQSAKETYTSRSGAHMKVDGAYITGGKNIILEAANVDIANSILQSKDIIIRSNHSFKAYTCFVEADTLVLESSPNSLFDIRFTFSKNPAVPPLVQGTIDFWSNKTDGGAFVVVGACKVEISFAPRAFE